MHSISDNRQIGQLTLQDISILSSNIDTEDLIPPIADGQGVADHVDINQKDPNVKSGAVTLSEPVVDPTQPPATFYEIVATLKQHLQTSALASLDTTQALNQQMGEARLAELNKAVDDVNVAKGNLLKGNQDLTEKNQQLADAQGNLAGKTSQLELAQTRLNKDQAYLQGVETDMQKYPDNPQVKGKYEVAKALVAQSQQYLSTAQDENAAASQAVTQAAAGAVAAAQYAVDAQNQVNTATDTLNNTSGPDPQAATALVQETKTALQVLTECMAKLTVLLNKYNEQKLDNDLRLFQAQQKRLQDECMAAQAKYDTAVEKAAHAQKWKKLAAKIASVVFLAVSAVAAVASFGTLSGLVALATVAVSAVDIGLDAKGKQTLSSMMTDPVMNKLVGAIAESIRKHHPELSEEQVQLRAGIAAMAVIIITVAVGSVAAKAGVNAIAARNPGFQNLLDGFARLGSAGPSIDRARLVMGYVESSTAVVNSGLQMGSGIIEGTALKDAAEQESVATILNAVLAVVKNMIEGTVDEFCKSNLSFNLYKHLSEWISANQSTAAGIGSNMRA